MIRSNLFDMTVSPPEGLAFNRVPPEAALGRGPCSALAVLGSRSTGEGSTSTRDSTHKWWAKRLGSVSRGILTAAVTDNEATALTAYGSATRVDGLTVFDPFAGSGTTVVEAIELKVTASLGHQSSSHTRSASGSAAFGYLRTGRAYKLVKEHCEVRLTGCTGQSAASLSCSISGCPASCPACSVPRRLFSTHCSTERLPEAVLEVEISAPPVLTLCRRYDSAH